MVGEEMMREAVNIAHMHDVTTEASGNVTLNNIRRVAETGVDFISVGYITHSAPWLDLSLGLLRPGNWPGTSWMVKTYAR